MADYKTAFLRHMDQKGLKYEDLDETTVRVSFSGDNTDNIVVYFSFDKDGDPTASVVCMSIAKFRKDKLGEGIATMNLLNCKYRWVRFCVDSDGDVRAEADAYFTEDSVGDVCEYYLHRMVSIVDESFPEIMKTLWG